MFQQKVLYEVNLPSFIVSFKNKLIQICVPFLQEAIHILKNDRNHDQFFKKSTQSIENLNTSSQATTGQVIVALLIAILSIQIIIGIFYGLFSKKRQRSIDKQAQEIDSSLAKEIMSLNRQIKSVKTALMKVSKLTEEKLSTAVVNGNGKGSKQKQYQSQNQAVSTESVKQLIKAYQKSIQSSNKIAEFMIQNQAQIVRELKKVKKNRVYSETTPSHTSAKDTSQLKTRKKQKYTNRVRNIEQEDHTHEVSLSSSNAQKINDIPDQVKPQLKQAKSQVYPISMPQILQKQQKKTQLKQQKRMQSKPQKKTQPKQQYEVQKTDLIEQEKAQEEQEQKTVAKKELPKLNIPIAPGIRKAVNKRIPPPVGRPKFVQQTPENQFSEVMVNKVNESVTQQPIKEEVIPTISEHQPVKQVESEAYVEDNVKNPSFEPTVQEQAIIQTEKNQGETVKRQLPAIRKIPAPPGKTGKRVPPPPGRK